MKEFLQFPSYLTIRGPPARAESLASVAACGPRGDGINFWGKNDTVTPGPRGDGIDF